MLRHHRVLIVLALVFVLTVALPLGADDNAALSEYGAAIHVTCNHPSPLNDRWHKSGEMLKRERPAGPIVNDLSSAVFTVTLPLELSVTRVGILQADYKGGFAMAKDLTVEMPGHAPRSFTLTQDTSAPQFFDYAGKGNRVIVRVNSVYPPRDEKTDQKRVYGSINQVQVLVSEDLKTLFAAPALTVHQCPPQIMQTPNLDPQAAAPVVGTPRKAEGHPCTIWDKQSIAELKAQIAKYWKARDAYDRIVAFCEKAVKTKIAVPAEPDLGTNPGVANQHTAAATAIANLGIGYALSGKEAYAVEARRMLLDYAGYYEGWPVHGHPKFRHDKSKWSWQRLGDSIWLIPAAWGYDLIHDSASLSDADREAIENHFLMPCARFIVNGSSGSLRSPTNWSVIMCAAAMTAARACGDRELYEMTLWGKKRDPDNISGGIYYYIDNGLDDDGMWGEGAIGYQFMAMRGLLVMAEILWHDGLDVYGYHNSRLKLIFDSPLWYCYPGGESSPAIHDSGGASLFNRDTHLYQYAKRRYADKTYEALLRRTGAGLESQYNLFLPACDFAPVEGADLPEVPSILFPGVGYALCRNGAAADASYLLLDYGPSRSHGHPDKLNFNLFALGQELFADAGSAWYSTDLYLNYYRHTLAHNTVQANELSQAMTGGTLAAYGSLGDLALIRAWCDTAIPGTTLDRTLIQSGTRLYDLFRVASNLTFTFDLPYHSHGEMQQSVATSSWKDHPGDKAGYKYFTDTVAAKVNGDWTCQWRVPRGRVELHALGEPGTEVVFGKTPKGGAKLPTVMIRRRTDDTVYAAVLDIVGKQAHPGQPVEEAPSGQATVRAVRRLGEGKSATGVVSELADGSTETALVNYTNGTVKAGEWTTDAQVALVRLRGGKLTDFYLAGGTALDGPGVTLRSTTSTLLVCRAVKDGLSVLANQGAELTSLSVTGLAVPDAVHSLDAKGQRLGRLTFDRVGAGLRLAEFPPRTACELSTGDQPSAAAFEAGRRRAKVQAMLKEEARLLAEATEAAEAQQAAAKANPLPAGTFYLVEAEDLTAQGGGEVKVGTTKTAIHGAAFSGWDNPGHWLDYTVTVDEDGWYQFFWKYCAESPTSRSVRVDGELPHAAFAEIDLEATGGWSNGADNWRLWRLEWPRLNGQPFLLHLTAGPHTIRVENVGGGGLNLDYLVLAESSMDVTREAVER